MRKGDARSDAAASPAAAIGQTETRLSFGGIALVGLLALIWGLNWPAIRVAVVEMSPWTFRGICLTVATVVLFGLAIAGGSRLTVPRREIGPLVLVALLNVTAWHLLTAYGLSMMEATRGILLGFTFPVWSVLFGTVMLRERLTRGRLTALALGIAAMVLLLGPEFARVGGAPLGGLLLVGAAIAWALATMTTKMFSWSMNARELAAWQVLLGGIPIVIGALVIDGTSGFRPLSTGAIVGLVYSSVIAASIGQWIWFQILRLMPSAVASISTLAIPVVGVFSSGLMLGEPVTWRELVALSLVLIALTVLLFGDRALSAIRKAWRAWEVLSRR